MKDYDDRKRTLVAGGAGFLGSHLIERLLKRGDEVLCIDNFLPARNGASRNSMITRALSSSWLPTPVLPVR